MKNFRFDIERLFNKEMKNFTPEDYVTLTDSITKFTGDYVDFNLSGTECYFSNLQYILSHKVSKESPYYKMTCLFNPCQRMVFKYVPPEYAESTLEKEELFFQNPINWDKTDSTDCNETSLRIDSVINKKKEYYDSLGDNDLVQAVWIEYEKFYNEFHAKLDEFRANVLVTCTSFVNPLNKKSDDIWKKFAVSEDQKDIEIGNRIANGVCFKIDSNGFPNKAYIVTYGTVGEDRVGRIVEKQIFNYSEKVNTSIFYEIAAEMLTSVYRKKAKFRSEMECRCALDEMGPAKLCELRKGSIKEVYFSSAFDETVRNRMIKLCNERSVPYHIC